MTLAVSALSAIHSLIRLTTKVFDMNVEITLLEGQKFQANFGNHQLISDQSVSTGGDESYPEPFDYLLPPILAPSKK
jgi:hypothetical protein